MDEQFKDIKISNKITKFIISENGCVFNKDTNKELPYHTNGGYVQVSLGKYGHKKVHRLVAEAFLKNDKNYPTVNHLNGIKSDNRVINLEWASYSMNNKHAYDFGLKSSIKGEDLHFSKYTEKQIREVCDEFMKGYTPKDISEKYNININLLRDVLYHKKWRHVSKDYNFPDLVRYTKEMKTEDKLNIINWLQSGHSILNIIKITGMECTRKNIDMVKYYKECIDNGRRFNDYRNTHYILCV